MKKLLKTGMIRLIILVLIALIVGVFGGDFAPKIAQTILKNGKNEKYLSQNQDIYADDEENEDESAECVVQRSRGGVVIESTSKRVLVDENMNARCYPASTTKVLTALCVLQNLPLEKIVCVPKVAEGVEGSSIYLKAGQEISVEDLLYGLMLRSGNDAAVTLAVSTSGSVDEFAALMNETAKQCGAVNSNFVNPHGLQDENHYTTAYDLALITAKAYEYDVFKDIVSCKTRKIVVDGQANYIANKNKLLGMFDGANGVKTGYTKTSGRCLVGGAVRDNMQLISVVLNYNDMWNDTIRMLEFAFCNYEMVDAEKAQFSNRDAQNVVHICLPQLASQDWSRVYYPLKKDGSERLMIDTK